MKVCIKCDKEKSETCFIKNKRSKSGIGSECKECYNLAKIQYLDKNRDRVRETNRRWYETHKDKILPDRREKSVKYREENRDKIAEYSSKYYYKNIEKAREKARQASKKKEAKEKRNARRDHVKGKNIFQIRARKILQAAIRVGHMTRPINCEICLKSCKPEGHHIDYSKPLEVNWLCRICHLHQHNKLLDVVP